MEKLFLFLAAGAFALLIVTTAVGAKLYKRRQTRLDAEAIAAPRAPRELTFEELWDERDAEFMRKWAHVTCRDYDREDKQAAFELITWRKAYTQKLNRVIDEGWDRVARVGRRWTKLTDRCFKDFADLQSDLMLAQGEGGYHGSVFNTCWTVEDAKKLNALLIQGARHYRKYKREVRIR